MFGLSIMYHPNKRYRQQTNAKLQSSNEQLKIVRDSKPYAHECPYCAGVFPSKSGNFNRCMSVHMNIAWQENNNEMQWEICQLGMWKEMVNLLMKK